MDYIRKFKRQIAIRALLAVMVPLFGALISMYFFYDIRGESIASSYLYSSIIGVFMAFITTLIMVKMSIEPVRTIEAVISYAAHDKRDSLPPNLEKVRLGRELIAAQSLLIYDLASVKHQNTTIDGNGEEVAVEPEKKPGIPDNVFDIVPIPIIGTDSEQNITFANFAATTLVGIELDKMLGKPLYDCMDLSFQGDNNLENWITQKKKDAVTATQSWERVRLEMADKSIKQFDLVAGYSKGSSSGTDIVLSVFDRSSKYNLDDKELSYVALAVHELRTPLTLLRGYIEVFEDELGPSLSSELVDFMHKMHASSQQLTAFVSNILNVARIEENQLALKLTSESWAETLKAAVGDLELRAQVYGKHIELNVAEDLPKVAVDRVSINEVINNLVDNAIKYGGNSEKIIITSKLNGEKLIETSIQDFGIGIPESVTGDLFKKFHRSHRSKAQVGGTGLGLYLSKALVSAHGGSIWVRSKEGEGSTFGFTLIPFDQLSEKQVTGEDGIIRGAHGWIKNHSLYRN